MPNPKLIENLALIYLTKCHNWCKIGVVASFSQTWKYGSHQFQARYLPSLSESSLTDSGIAVTNSDNDGGGVGLLVVTILGGGRGRRSWAPN